MFLREKNAAEQHKQKALEDLAKQKEALDQHAAENRKEKKNKEDLEMKIKAMESKVRANCVKLKLDIPYSNGNLGPL